MYVIKHLIYGINKHLKKKIQPVLIVNKGLSKEAINDLKNFNLIKTNLFHNRSLFDKLHNKLSVIFFGRSSSYENFFIKEKKPFYSAIKNILTHSIMPKNRLLCKPPAHKTVTKENHMPYSSPADLPAPNGSAPARGQDDSSPVIAVDHHACILCDRCIRACDDVQHNDVIGRTGKGYETRISFDLDLPMGESSCVSCGECVAACPTGALVNKDLGAPIRPRDELKTVDSVCPYCGVGCAIRYHADPERNLVVFAEGRESPGNQGRLCVKGRYGFDYATHPQRLTKPLIRIDYPKRALSPEVVNSKRRRGRRASVVDYDQVMPAFREASWDEALDLVALRLSEIRERDGGGALAGFGSAIRVFHTPPSSSFNPARE